MKKAELVREMAIAAEISSEEAARALEAILKIVEDSLRQGEKVQIAGFGTFLAKERAARKGMNPNNGEEILIGARKVPTFKVGKVLRENVKMM